MFDTLISTITVGAGGAAQIAFTSIPQTFSELVLVVSARATAASNTIVLNINGAATNIATLNMFGNGATQSSAAATTFFGFAPMTTDTANIFSNAQLTISNYAGSTTKGFSIDACSENNGAVGYAMIGAGHFADTTPITSLSLNLVNFAQFSSASLYGITRGTSGGTTVA